MHSQQDLLEPTYSGRRPWDQRDKILAAVLGVMTFFTVLFFILYVSKSCVCPDHTTVIPTTHRITTTFAPSSTTVNQTTSVFTESTSTETPTSTAAAPAFPDPYTDNVIVDANNETKWTTIYPFLMPLLASPDGDYPPIDWNTINKTHMQDWRTNWKACVTGDTKRCSLSFPPMILPRQLEGGVIFAEFDRDRDDAAIVKYGFDEFATKSKNVTVKLDIDVPSAGEGNKTTILAFEGVWLLEKGFLKGNMTFSKQLWSSFDENNLPTANVKVFPAH